MGQYDLLEYYLNDRIKDIDIFAIENYAYRGSGQLADLGEMMGLFKFYVHKKGKSFVMVQSKTVKRLVAGSGNASKQDVKESLSNYLINHDVIEFNNLDESDATAIAIGLYLKMKEDEHKED